MVSPPVAEHGAIRVLLVETRAELSNTISRYLDGRGFSVKICRDAKEAEAAFAAEPFDAVVADTVLPGRSGIDFAASVRGGSGGERLGIILMSLLVQPESVADADRLTVADKVFGAPLSLPSLYSSLVEVVRERAGRSVSRPTGSTALAAVNLKLQDPLSRSDKIKVPKLDGFAGPKPIEQAGAVGLFLLHAARLRCSGVVVIEDSRAVMKIAMLRGVPVGAADNAHENMLGQRLLRAGLVTTEHLDQVSTYLEQHQVRVGEALLALGVIDEDVLVEQLEIQARERVTRAVGVPSGVVYFRDDIVEARRMAIVDINVFDAILGWYRRFPDTATVSSWLLENRDAVLYRTVDFESGLAAYGRLEPQSPLPQILFAGEDTLSRTYTTLERMGKGFGARHLPDLYAFAMAELVVPGEPPDVKAAVPVALPPDDSVATDRAAVRKVHGEWIRVSGRTFYEMLRVSPRAAGPEIQRALAKYTRELDEAVEAPNRLGPAAKMYSDLRARLEACRGILSDEDRRLAYDTEITGFDRSLSCDVTPISERHFRAALRAISDYDLDTANRELREAIKHAPQEAEYHAHLGWTYVLRGKEHTPTGLDLIRGAHQLNPTAMRPLFFLGLVAIRMGQDEYARRYLMEAARRCPDDPSLMLAFDVLPGDSAFELVDAEPLLT